MQHISNLYISFFKLLFVAGEQYRSRTNTTQNTWVVGPSICSTRGFKLGLGIVMCWYLFGGVTVYCGFPVWFLCLLSLRCLKGSATSSFRAWNLKVSNCNKYINIIATITYTILLPHHTNILNPTHNILLGWFVFRARYHLKLIRHYNKRSIFIMLTPACFIH